MSSIKIYHNPACGTSRNTLALIRNSGAEARGDFVSGNASQPRTVGCATGRDGHDTARVAA